MKLHKLRALEVQFRKQYNHRVSLEPLVSAVATVLSGLQVVQVVQPGIAGSVAIGISVSSSL